MRESPDLMIAATFSLMTSSMACWGAAPRPRPPPSSPPRISDSQDLFIRQMIYLFLADLVITAEGIRLVLASPGTTRPPVLRTQMPLQVTAGRDG